MEVGLHEKLKGIKIVFMDVDGCLTDGGLYYANSGERMKKFHVRDGLGIKLLQKAGIEVAFITGLESEIVSSRASDLGIKHLVQGCFDKDVAAEKILAEVGYSFEQSAFLCDDLIDMGLLEKVAWSVAVADAATEVQEAADYITATPGGFGAAREMIEMILAAQAEK
jgi:3-deoxy-D-manno-octulosonate 8-phosphate phosphatase (KDO 8-P phosphatase)